MENILNLIVNAENVRIALLAVLGFCGFVLMGRRMDRMEYSLNKKIDDLRHNDLAAIHKRIDNVESSIKELKFNDFAHLNNAIKALTFTLKKNGSITDEDKDYIDANLAI